jgi:superfamily II DNA helicase RecQ
VDFHLQHCFPSGEVSATLSAVEDVAEMSGHSAATHSQTYGSAVCDGKEYLYRKYHDALGDATSPETAGLVVISEFDLKAGLEYSFGQGASYTCNAQKRLVNSMLSRTHRHASLPCGAGKSMAWLLPLVANALKNSSQQAFSIVVLPYQCLASYHCQTADTFSRNLNVWVSMFHPNEFGPFSFPPDLQDDDILADIVFLSLDGLNCLIKHQFARLRRLCQHGKVTTIFLDEIHTIFVEGFRSSYETLPRLASLGIPIVTMSATVPRPYLPHLLRYLNMTETIEGPMSDVTILDHGGSVTGHFPLDFRFRLSVSVSPNSFALAMIGRILRKSPSHSIHVIVASRIAAAEILSELQTDNESRMVTSHSSREEIDETAQLWKEGMIKVLISTTIGLVGNESKSCRHVLIVGYIYNLMSVVQAMGRLRLSQRIDGATIDVIVPKLSSKRVTECEIQSRNEFEKLLSRKLVPSDWDSFKKFSTTLGIVAWVDTPGCQLANLDKIFGHSRDNCQVCSVCINGPLIETATIASKVFS